METAPKDGIILVKLGPSPSCGRYGREIVLSVWHEGEWLEIDRNIQKGSVEDRYQRDVYYKYLELIPIKEESIEGWISALVPNDFHFLLDEEDKEEGIMTNSDEIPYPAIWRICELEKCVRRLRSVLQSRHFSHPSMNEVREHLESIKLANRLVGDDPGRVWLAPVLGDEHPE